MVPRLYGRQANWLLVVGLKRNARPRLELIGRQINSQSNQVSLARYIPGASLGHVSPLSVRASVTLSISRAPFVSSCLTTRLYGQAARAISTSQLNVSQRFHTSPINVVVFDGPLGSLKLQGDLILKEASRLDAFSGYPVRT